MDCDCTSIHGQLCRILAYHLIPTQTVSRRWNSFKHDNTTSTHTNRWIVQIYNYNSAGNSIDLLLPSLVLNHIKTLYALTIYTCTCMMYNVHVCVCIYMYTYMFTCTCQYQYIPGCGTTQQ